MMGSEVPNSTGEAPKNDTKAQLNELKIKVDNVRFRQDVNGTVGDSAHGQLHKNAVVSRVGNDEKTKKVDNKDYTFIKVEDAEKRQGWVAKDFVSGLSETEKPVKTEAQKIAEGDIATLNKHLPEGQRLQNASALINKNPAMREQIIKALSGFDFLGFDFSGLVSNKKESITNSILENFKGKNISAEKFNDTISRLGVKIEEIARANTQISANDTAFSQAVLAATSPIIKEGIEQSMAVAKVSANKNMTEQIVAKKKQAQETIIKT